MPSARPACTYKLSRSEQRYFSDLNNSYNGEVTQRPLFCICGKPNYMNTNGTARICCPTTQAEYSIKQEQIKEQNKAAEAAQRDNRNETDYNRIKDTIKTPLYDEMISKLADLNSNETLFYTYVQKLQETYPTIRIEVTPMVPGPVGNVAQSFHSGHSNYFRSFKEAEKRCIFSAKY